MSDSVSCSMFGSPDWWRDYQEFMCELPDGHEGPHRQTIEWGESNTTTEASVLDGWNDPHA